MTKDIFRSRERAAARLQGSPEPAPEPVVDDADEDPAADLGEAVEPADGEDAGAATG